MSRAGEFIWIEQHFAPLSGGVSFALKDDAAQLTGSVDVVTQDMLVEGVHFLPSDSPRSVAIKAVRVNISDCVAKGARPVGTMLALGIPDRWSDEDIADFAAGLADAGLGSVMPLVGGDTTRSPDRLTVCVTVLGDLEGGSYVSRLGARAGGTLCVNGPIGDAALGLHVATGGLDAPGKAHWLHAYREPPDQTGFETIVREFAEASMDISDGLLGDCAKLCAASGVSAIIERDRIPLSAPTREHLAAHDADWPKVLDGGDDYRILMALPGGEFDAASRAATKIGWTLHEIGQVGEERDPRIALTVNGVAMSVETASYTHR